MNFIYNRPRCSRGRIIRVFLRRNAKNGTACFRIRCGYRANRPVVDIFDIYIQFSCGESSIHSLYSQTLKCILKIEASEKQFSEASTH
jgi:hypothetical protein